MTVFLPDLEAQITTPHQHEGAANRPLWLIWHNRQGGDGWSLHCIADTEDRCRYMIECYGGPTTEIIVERTPANHAFASSVEEMLREANHRIAVQTYSHIHGYRRQGD